jgi:hypothetical protein
MKRTIKEIKKYIKLHRKDFFLWKSEDAVFFLPFEEAKEFFKEDYIKKVESGEEEYKQLTDPVKEIKGYMPFAWNKANNCRGISALRSISHMSCYLWLDGQDKLSKEIEEYTYYGKPQLVQICNLYNIDWKQYDGDCWVNDECDTPITAEEALKKLGFTVNNNQEE